MSENDRQRPGGSAGSGWASHADLAGWQARRTSYPTQPVDEPGPPTRQEDAGGWFGSVTTEDDETLKPEDDESLTTGPDWGEPEQQYQMPYEAEHAYEAEFAYEPAYEAEPDPEQDYGVGDPPAAPPQQARRGRFRHRAGVVALVLAAMAVGRFVTQFGADETDLARPFLRSGTVGQPVQLRYADVTVTGVEGSACVSDGFSIPLRSPGVFLVVPLKVVARGEPAGLGYASVVDTQGRVFEATSGRSQFTFGTGQTGVARYASVVVEMPPDAVPGARLRVALNLMDQRQDDMSDIDLGLTSKDAEKFVASRQIITIGQAGEIAPTPQPSPTKDPLADVLGEKPKVCEGPV